MPALLATWNADARRVPLANPLSAELGVMRTQLLPGPGRRACAQHRAPAGARAPVRTRQGVRRHGAGRSADRNVAHRRRRLRRCAPPSNGASASRAVDFHDLKGDLDSLAATVRRDARISALAGAACGHPGRSADVFRDGTAARLDRPTASAPAAGVGSGRRCRCLRTRPRTVAGTHVAQGRRAVEVSVRPPGPRVRRRRFGAVGGGRRPASRPRRARRCAIWCCSTATPARAWKRDSRVSLWA